MFSSLLFIRLRQCSSSFILAISMQYVPAVIYFPCFKKLWSWIQVYTTNKNHNILFEDLGHKEDCTCFIFGLPMAIFVYIAQNPLYIAGLQYGLNTEKKRRENFISVDYLIFLQIVWYPFLEHFWLSDCMQVTKGRPLANLQYFGQFSCRCLWIFRNDVF